MNLPKTYLLLIFLTAATSFSQNEIEEFYNTKEINRILRIARYEVYNSNIYKNEEGFKGKIISGTGVYIEEPAIDLENNSIQITSGRGKAYLNYIIYLDHPLPEPPRFGENIQRILPGYSYRIFAEFIGCKDFITNGGFRQYLPTFKCLLIYNLDDRENRFPLWISDTLKK